MQRTALGALWVYRRVVSPFLHALCGPACGCRFSPTCSEFAGQAVRQHGALKGGLLAMRRLCRCHPWGGCGEDPVPREFKLAPLGTWSFSRSRKGAI